MSTSVFTRSVVVMLSVVSKAAALFFVFRIFSTRFVAPIPTLYKPSGDREVVVAQRVVEMRTKSGTSKRLRFNRITPLPALLLLFLVFDVASIGIFEYINVFDGFVLLLLFDFALVDETKGFFLFIICSMTSVCVWSPSAKIRRFTASLCLVLYYIVVRQWITLLLI